MQAVSPKQAALWIADKRDAMGDPEFRALNLEHDAAFDWSPDDPRLYSLADRTKLADAGLSKLRRHPVGIGMEAQVLLGAELLVDGRLLEALADVLEYRRPPEDVQVCLLLACEGAVGKSSAVALERTA